MFSVKSMCRALRIHSSGFYAFLKRGQSARRVRDEELKDHVKHHFDKGRRLYGSTRIHQALQAEGEPCSRKRVTRLMNEMELTVRVPKKWVRTTNSSHSLPLSPNRLNREFKVEQVPGLNRVWAGDISYIWTAEGWLYLAVVLDLKSRRVIGWSMAATLEQPLVQDALTMAIQCRGLKPVDQRKTDHISEEESLLFHSDRGGQYAGHSFRLQLETFGIEPSMSGKGDCWDNAPVESFFATLKKELVYREHYATREQAKASLFEYIEGFYNRIRMHSALGYDSPLKYETNLL